MSEGARGASAGRGVRGEGRGARGQGARGQGARGQGARGQGARGQGHRIKCDDLLIVELAPLLQFANHTSHIGYWQPHRASHCESDRHSTPVFLKAVDADWERSAMLSGGRLSGGRNHPTQDGRQEVLAPQCWQVLGTSCGLLRFVGPKRMADVNICHSCLQHQGTGKNTA